MTRQVFLWFMLLGATAWVGAAQPMAKTTYVPHPSRYECRWVDSTITMDGRADEPAWKHAEPIADFYLPWLREQARAARTATRARLLWDREFLYFLAEMDDHDLYADVTEHDGMIWNNDVFELFFHPQPDQPGYYEFQVNAANTVLDMFLPRRGAGGYQRFVREGDFQLETTVARRGTLNEWRDRDEGWTVEGRIPWKDFLRTGGRPEPGAKWRFALCRYDYSVTFEGPELSTCAPLNSSPHADFHHYEDYATLTFVGPQAATNEKSNPHPFGIAQRVPPPIPRVVGSPDPPLPYRPRKTYPQLKIDFPIEVASQPGSDQMLLIAQSRSYGDSTLARFRDHVDVDRFENLLDFPGTAYALVFHPRFMENGYFYVGMNGAITGKSGKYTRILRFTMNPKPPYTLDKNSLASIIEWPSDGHNGGALAFGNDGMLYITSGDGTSDSDTHVMGQGLDHLLSKVLRIDVDHAPPGKMYSIPMDNPFWQYPKARAETWAYGLRNPWRMTADPRTGHLWVGNNGQDLWEQVYFIRKGENYGWSVQEGSHPFYLERPRGPTPIVKPAAEHHHSEARSLTGGVVYHGQRLPELRGAYIYGDYSTGKIWGIRHNGQQVTWHRELSDTTLQITGFALDTRGELLISDHRGQQQGAIYTLEPTPPEKVPRPFPRRLSETGLFQSVPAHIPHPGLIPYSVNAPLWSDDAHKERWIALPNRESTIDIASARGWNFPDLTVLVKSFALEREVGNPASRFWIETRLLTKQEGEWVGYSYRWNPAQTEAELVDSAGLDEDYAQRVPSTKDQPPMTKVTRWRFPSRAECMVCHSRAANYVLGLSELQMNKDHDYYGIRDNQLRVLEHLGIVRGDWHAAALAEVRDTGKKRELQGKALEDYVRRQTLPQGHHADGRSCLLPQSPARMKKLVDPDDKSQPLAARARSYLHANCAHCHVEAGGGNARMDLEFSTDLDRAKIVDEKPVHHTFGLPDARVLAPGHPERSVLWHRVSHRQVGHMPPLATRQVDQQAADLIAAWIKELGTPKAKQK